MAEEKPSPQNSAPQYDGESYARFRPQYPAELYQKILDYCGGAPRETAVDIGTGTGQAAVTLADHYARVLACDVSAAQLKNAVQRPNIQYFCSPAESTELPEHSVDLATSATAFHWFDRDAYFAEMARLLRPGGVLAIWTINRATVEAPAEAAQLFESHILEALAPYWDERAQLAERGYAEIQIPKEHFTRVESCTYHLPRQCTAGQVAGLVASWSSYAAYSQSNPASQDLLPQFQQELVRVTGAAADQPVLTVASRISLVLAIASHESP